MRYVNLLFTYLRILWYCLFAVDLFSCVNELYLASVLGVIPPWAAA